jgi:Flp pilus assembly protein TadB
MSDPLEVKDVKVLTKKELEQLGLKGRPRKRFRLVGLFLLVCAALYIAVFFVGLWVSIDYLIGIVLGFFQDIQQYFRTISTS